MLTGPITKGVSNPASKRLNTLYHGIGYTELEQFIRSLYGNGQNGAFYIPKPTVLNKRVLFQDSVGTTPVTADGDPVGLMLDLHKGLVKGAELVANGTFDADISGWTDASEEGASVSWGSDGVLSLTSPGGGIFARARTTIPTAQGASYQLEMDSSAVVVLSLGETAGGSELALKVTGSGGLESLIFTAASEVTHVQFRHSSEGTRDVDNVTIRELSGNHATQETSASRPIYRTDGTLHWLEFDGVDDSMAADSVLIGLDDFLFGVAFRTQPDNTGPEFSTILSEGGTGAGEWMMRAVNSGKTPSIYADSGGFAISVGSLGISEKAVMTVRREGSSGYLNANTSNLSRSGEDPSAGVDLSSSSPLYLGGANDETGRYWKGPIYGVLISVGNGSDLLNQQITSYLATLSGVTL